MEAMVMLEGLLLFINFITDSSSTSDFNFMPHYRGNSHNSLEIAQCSPGYIFCLESFQCVPDEPEFLDYADNAVCEDISGKYQPTQCPTGTIFCLETMECISMDPEECLEEETRTPPESCPVGTVFCLELMDCVPDPDVPSFGSDCDEDEETWEKPGIPTPKPAHPQTRPPEPDDSGATSNPPHTDDSTSPTKETIIPGTKATLPPGLAQDVRGFARNINKEAEKVEQFVEDSLMGFGRSLRNIFS